MFGQGIDSFLGAFGAALKAILSAIHNYRREREQSAAQSQRDASDADPAGWFIDHFSGVRELPKPSAPTDKADVDPNPDR